MKVLIGVMLGGIIGFFVGYFGHCSSGTCPLTGNPVVATVVGALIGLLIAKEQ